MASVRQEILRRFPPLARIADAHLKFEDSVYAMLSFNRELDLIVDGWTVFHVTRESDESLDAVGLMMLLPVGSVPMAINISTSTDGLDWTLQVGMEDRQWLALSDSKRWNKVYLYATGSRAEPDWTWGRQYRGFVRYADD